MKKIKNIGIIFLTVIIVAVASGVFIVKAEGSNLTSDNKWLSSVSNTAEATITTNGSTGFTADMSSIGTGEWDVKVSMNGINLKAGETYIYEADITSDKRRGSVFVQVLNDDGAIMYNNYLVDLEANSTKHLIKTFTADKDYNNATIVYGIGFNNYEATFTSWNSANVITVENSKLVNINNFDYSSLKYTNFTNNYQNYSYAIIDNIRSVASESRVDLAKDTVVIEADTSAIATDTNGKYKIYLNGVQTDPVVVDSGNWYHFDYNKLIYEYNVLESVSTEGVKAIVVIKNEQVVIDAKAEAIAEINIQ